MPSISAAAPDRWLSADTESRSPFGVIAQPWAGAALVRPAKHWRRHIEERTHTMMKKVWVKDPHSGGVKIPEGITDSVRNRIVGYAEEHYAGKYVRIDVRFKGCFCYIDAYTEPFVPEDYDSLLFGETREEYIERLRNIPTHLCRLRYKGDEERWTMAFYTYSHDKYEPSVFDHGGFFGTPEEAFQTSAVYLED